MRNRRTLLAAAIAAIIAISGLTLAVASRGDGAKPSPTSLPEGTQTIGRVRLLPDGWAAIVTTTDATPKPTVVPKGKQIRSRDLDPGGELKFTRSFQEQAKARRAPVEIGRLIDRFFDSARNWETRWRTDRWADIHDTLLQRLRLTQRGIITVDSFRPLPDAQCPSLPYYVDYPIGPCAVVSVTVTTQGGPVDFPNLVVVKELGLWKVTDAVACSYMTDLGCQRG
ncbi:MAG TPA: hypothetical protein VHD87_03965 [Acidimicrobiales bacterium]|nr:hypothetical protein [Acidimicrobiales bacterium]